MKRTFTLECTSCRRRLSSLSSTRSSTRYARRSGRHSSTISSTRAAGRGVWTDYLSSAEVLRPDAIACRSHALGNIRRSYWPWSVWLEFPYRVLEFSAGLYNLWMRLKLAAMINALLKSFYKIDNFKRILNENLEFYCRIEVWTIWAFLKIIRYKIFGGLIDE